MRTKDEQSLYYYASFYDTKAKLLRARGIKDD